MRTLNKIQLIAACGMNCSICRAYLREKNKCPGCRGTDVGKPMTRIKCKIKNCAILKKSKLDFCFQCEKFPCAELKHLDQRYSTKYYMSMMENLGNIKKLGIRKFLSNEKIRWTCPECGGTICAHTGKCYNCGKKI